MRHWQVFVRIAELGSVKRAAEAIGLSQPSVTQALADLEELLECKLFLRHARGMKPLPVAQALLPLTRRMLATLDEGVEQVIALEGRAAAVVRVAAIPAAVSGLLAQALPRFCQGAPEVVVHLREADALQQAALIERAEVDVALCRAPDVTPEGWEFTPLVEDRFAIVAGPRHPLRGKATVSLSDLRRATWLPTPAASAPRAAFDRLFADDARPPPMRPLLGQSPSMMLAMLSHEPLLVLVPWSFARQLIEAGQLVELRTSIALPFEPLGMLLPVAGVGPAVERLATHLRSVCAGPPAGRRSPARAEAFGR